MLNYGALQMKRLLMLLCIFYAPIVYAQEAIDEDVIRTDSTTNSTVTTQSDTTTTLKSPPASAISPTINTSNSDLCTFGVAGAIQTQILGISTGTQVTDENCERMKLAKNLYNMGMKVAAVSALCQDERVFDAMMMAGTPCPFDGMIGNEARAAWEANVEMQPNQELEEEGMSDATKTLVGAGGVASLLLLLLL